MVSRLSKILGLSIVCVSALCIALATFDSSRSWLSEIPHQLSSIKGRLLILLIRDGMTWREVRLILGQPDGVSSEGSLCATYYYLDYGYVISFDDEGRVTNKETKRKGSVDAGFRVEDDSEKRPAKKTKKRKR